MNAFPLPLVRRSRAGVALALAAVLSAGLAGRTEAESRADASRGQHSNRLARESSPYLLQHAHNPVDWYPWGPEAFAQARKENKLVFLSIGYSSCHWCHVMEKESFEDEEVAKVLNRDFVCIKVDREERPDIDNVYLTALQAMGRPGGWPLSLFLLPDGKPIVGGTYWPREDREDEGRKVPGFKSLLRVIHQAYVDDPKGLRELAEQNADRTAFALAGQARGRVLVELNRNLVVGAVDGLKEEFDPVHGGFGSPRRKFQGSKFPSAPALLLLQHEAARSKDRELERMVTLTLEHMARGGIYDQLGGGFHRYSTERTWTVPHFEKMLYDNAQLLEVYAKAYRTTRKPLSRRVLQETMGFVARVLTAPEGAFYSALDADSQGEEGRFYVWTDKEIDTVLSDRADAALFKKVYGADGPPNFDQKYHVLFLPRPLEEVPRDLGTSEEKLKERLAGMRRKLLVARAGRPRPFLDQKVLTAWNGQMIAGLVRAGQALGEKEPIERAARAADFVLTHMRTRDGRLLRSYAAIPGQQAEARVNGYLDDYAYLVHGLLALHEATREKRWLDEARVLTDTMVRWHEDRDNGGFFYTGNDHEKLFARAKDQYDGAQPSGNSMAADNLVRLWDRTGEARYGKLAERTFKSLAGSLKSNPSSLPALADALALYLEVKEKKK